MTTTETTTAILVAFALLVTGCTNDNTNTVAESTTAQSFPDLSDTKSQPLQTAQPLPNPNQPLEQTKAEIEEFMHGSNEKWHACVNQPSHVKRQLPAPEPVITPLRLRPQSFSVEKYDRDWSTAPAPSASCTIK